MTDYNKKLLEQIESIKDEKIVFWGASLFLEEFLKENNLEKYNIVGIIDKNSARWGEKLNGYKILSPDILKTKNNVIVILTIFNNNMQRYYELKDFLSENFENIKLADNIFGNLKEQLAYWFYNITGEVLNLENPKTFNEKIQWMKLYDSTPLKTRLADKYLVRKWVKDKIGEKYLVPLLGVWDSFDEINFDLLPNQFVLKCNHGCGYNYIVKDKSTFNIDDARQKINAWLNENYEFLGFEMHYAGIPKKIIAEEYIKPEDSNIEIQVWCFMGKLHYISYQTDKNDKAPRRQMFLPNWEKAGFKINPKFDVFKKTPPKPVYLDELKNIVKILAKDFKHARIDLIPINNKLFFREITFTSGSGLIQVSPKEKNLELGNLIDLGGE